MLRTKTGSPCVCIFLRRTKTPLPIVQTLVVAGFAFVCVVILTTENASRHAQTLCQAGEAGELSPLLPASESGHALFV
jgi:hypothetical protein